MGNIVQGNGGYVYYVDGSGNHVQLDHYSQPMSAEDGRRLFDRCQKLESLGVPISFANVIFFWTWFKDATSETPYLALMKHTPEIWINRPEETVVICDVRQEGGFVFFQMPDKAWQRKDYVDEEHNSRALSAIGYQTAPAGQSSEHLGVCYGSTEGVVAFLKAHNVPEDLLDLAI